MDRRIWKRLNPLQYIKSIYISDPKTTKGKGRLWAVYMLKTKYEIEQHKELIHLQLQLF